jgi:hypothetical protein
MSNYRTWLLGITTSVLLACGVESPPADPAPETGSTQSALSAAPDPGVIIPRAFHQPGSSCKPGAFALCCPFPQGCSCPGTQDCGADGTWGSCDGAGSRDEPCP